MVSIQSLVLIAVDRFIAIVFPLKAIKITSRIRAVFLITTWFLPQLAFIPYFVYSKIVEEGQQTFCRNTMSGLALKIYYLFGFAVFYCALLSLILVLYHLIMKHKKRRAKLDKGYRSNIHAKRLKQMKTLWRSLDRWRWDFSLAGHLFIYTYLWDCCIHWYLWRINVSYLWVYSITYSYCLVQR